MIVSSKIAASSSLGLTLSLFFYQVWSDFDPETACSSPKATANLGPPVWFLSCGLLYNSTTVNLTH